MIGVQAGVGRSRVTRQVLLATDCHFNIVSNKYQITHALFGPGQDTATPYRKSPWTPGTLQQGKALGRKLHRTVLAQLKVSK